MPDTRRDFIVLLNSTAYLKAAFQWAKSAITPVEQRFISTCVYTLSGFDFFGRGEGNWPIITNSGATGEQRKDTGKKNLWALAVCSKGDNLTCNAHHCRRLNKCGRNGAPRARCRNLDSDTGKQLYSVFLLPTPSVMDVRWADPC